jgi:hypothetical protein
MASRAAQATVPSQQTTSARLGSTVLAIRWVFPALHSGGNPPRVEPRLGEQLLLPDHVLRALGAEPEKVS